MRPPELRVHYTKISSWWFGLFLVIFGAICDFLALVTLTQPFTFDDTHYIPFLAREFDGNDDS